MVDKYAVFGNPIAHSKSPFLHQRFAQQTAQQLEYDKQLVAVGEFAQACETFFNSGGCGLSVTLPFKQDAYNYAHSLSERAKRAGAVNTLGRDAEGGIWGDNTDGVGFVTDIRWNLCWSIQDKRLLVLGAGGAVRGILAPLLQQGPQYIVIANRTVEKAQALVRDFSDLGTVMACGFQDPMLSQQKFDGIVNGTSSSLDAAMPELPSGLLHTHAWAYDLAYAEQSTVFMQWAKAQGVAKVSDGFGMLVEQGAEAFYLWRGVRPDTSVVRLG